MDDNLVEDTESIVVQVVPIPCPPIFPIPPECYQVGDPDQATAYIRDNDRTNERPKVEIVNPESEQRFPLGAEIPIEVVARDPDGWVSWVEFFANGEKIGEDFIVFIQPPPPGQVQRFSMVWTDAPAGRHVLTARATDNRGAVSESAPVPISVLEPCRLPVLNITTPDPIASEQDPLSLAPLDTGTFRISRTCGTNDDLTVYFLVSGSASNGEDYDFIRGHAIIPAGSASVDVIVNPIDDLLVEETETVVITLVRQDCVGDDLIPLGCYLVGQSGRGIVYIRDNDLPPNRPPVVDVVSPPDGSVFLAPVDIRLVAAAKDPDGWVETVEFFADGVSLGVVRNNPWILDPIRNLDAQQTDPGGINTNPDGTVILDPSPDPIPIPINPFTLIWRDAPPGTHEITAVATDNAGDSTTSDPIQIKVVPPPVEPIVTVLARDPIATEGCPDDPNADCIDPATFVIHRTGPTDRPLRVFYRLGGTAINGEDYTELPNSAVIPEGSSVTRVVIIPIDDTLVEGPERVILSLVDPPCLDAEPIDILAHPDVISLDCYQVGRAHIARAVIFDNDDPPNEPPFVKIISPEDGSIFRAPASVRLVAAAFDLDGDIVQVEFFEGDNSLGIAEGPILEPVPFDPAIEPDPNQRLVREVYTLLWEDVPAGKYALTAVATDNSGAESISEPVEIKVVDPQDPPVVNITTLDGIAAEQDPALDIPEDVAVFEVTRTGDTSRPLTVFYRVGGTATNGEDYEMLSGRVIIEAGQSAAEIVVNPIDDLLCEGRESVRVRLVPHLCIQAFPPTRDCYLVGQNDRARAVILDDEICPPNQPPRVAIVRPQDGDVFRAPADIIVCAEAKDPDGRVVRVQFMANGEVIGGVNLTSAGEPELFCIRWADVPAGAYQLTAVATDNDGASTRSDPINIRVIQRPVIPVVTIEATDEVGSENGDQARFMVTRSCCEAGPLSVRYSLSGTASNGEDYSQLSGVVTIPDGALRAPIIIDPIDDNLVEGTESVIATLQPSLCDLTLPPIASCYLVGRPNRDVVYIRDNDSEENQPPRIAILNPIEGSVFPAPASIDILAVGLDPDGWIGLVEFFANDDKIGEIAINFIVPPPPGELQTFELDWDRVPPGRYVLTARATDNRGASTDSGPIHIAVVDPCAVPEVTVHATDPIASEAGSGTGVNTGTFTIRRSCGLSTPLLVNYALSGRAENGIDYIMLTGTALIEAGESETEVIVEPIDDDLPEGTEDVVLRLIESPCDLNSAIDPAFRGCYMLGLRRAASVFIQDDENLPPLVNLIRPFDGQFFKAPATIQLVAEALDPDGWITQIEFLEGDNVIGGQAILVSEPPPPGQVQVFEFTWENVPEGQYSLTARVTDNDGDVSTSDPVNITVTEADPPPLVSICAFDGLAIEGSNNHARFRIERTGSTNTPLTVFYNIGGTADNGVDYKRIDDSVTIPAGRRAVVLLIEADEDNIREEFETVILRLRLPSPSPVPPPYTIGRPEVGAAVIADRNVDTTLCFRLDNGFFYVCLPGRPGTSFELESTANLTGAPWK